MSGLTRILVCGDRHWGDDPGDGALMDIVLNGLLALGPFLVIEGEARGADTMAREWATRNRLPTERYPADWKTYGDAAGPIRNKQMLDEGRPGLVVAFHRSLATSKGTADMVRQARARGIEVQVYPRNQEGSL